MSTKYEKKTDSLLLITGNHEGDVVISNINSDNNEIEPRLTLKGGHKKTIRNVDIHSDSGDIFTRGEDCRLCRWNYSQLLQGESDYKKEKLSKHSEVNEKGQDRGGSNYNHVRRESKLRSYVDKMNKKF